LGAEFQAANQFRRGSIVTPVLDPWVVFTPEEIAINQMFRGISRRSQKDHSRPLFRSSESLQRLLRFLADRSLAGEGDQLKEYSIGIDAFGRPPEYDPRHESAVRIQVGRLRQKLSEYYLLDGKNDPVLVELPKGGFKIRVESRAPAPEPLATEPPPQAPKPARFADRPWIVPALAAGLAFSLGWAVWSTLHSGLSDRWRLPFIPRGLRRSASYGLP